MIRRTVTQPGQIEPFKQALIYAKVPSFVEEYLVDIGDQVHQGQLLAKLLAPELDRDLEQKKALVAQANAELEQSQAQAKVVEAETVSARAAVKEAAAAVDRREAEHSRWTSEYDRVVQLVSRSAVPKKLADETKAQMLAARAASDEASAAIERAQSDLATRQAQVEKAHADEVAARARCRVAEAEQARAAALVAYLRIEAPFDGTISTRSADTGYYAQPPNATNAAPLFTLVRIDPVRVFVNVPEIDAPKVDPVDHATIVVQALGNNRFAGMVTRSSWTLNPDTRTLRVEIDIPNPEGKLRPGMYAHVSVDVAQQEDALVIPASAVQSVYDAPCVYVAIDNKATRKSVEPGIRAGDDLEILSGLDDNDAVILAKDASIKDGQPVNIVSPASAK